MVVTTKEGTYPALSQYAHQRLCDKGMRHRDIGLAIGEALFAVYGERRVAGLALDSETVRETLAQRFLRELEGAGYRVEFHALATHR
jgi:hypothetical protein